MSRRSKFAHNITSRCEQRSHFDKVNMSIAIYILYMYVILWTVGGTVALWLVLSTPVEVVWVLTLA